MIDNDKTNDHPETFQKKLGQSDLILIHYIPNKRIKREPNPNIECILIEGDAPRQRRQDQFIRARIGYIIRDKILILELPKSFSLMLDFFLLRPREVLLWDLETATGEVGCPSTWFGSTIALVGFTLELLTFLMVFLILEAMAIK